MGGEPNIVQMNANISPTEKKGSGLFFEFRGPDWAFVRCCRGRASLGTSAACCERCRARELRPSARRRKALIGSDASVERAGDDVQQFVGV